MTDILLTDSNEILIENGDLSIGFCDHQNKKLLLLISKGDLKNKPLVGVGVNGYLKDNDDGVLLGEVKSEFEKDGMTVNKITLSNYNLEIEAAYESSANNA